MRWSLMDLRISTELTERARRLYAVRGIILSPEQVQTSLLNLGKVIAQLQAGGVLQTNAANQPAFCWNCGSPIFSTERYVSESNAGEADRFLCQHCAEATSGKEDR